MDTQDPPTDPAISLLGSNRFRQQKRCYDVMLSRQEVNTMRHLANAQYWDRPADPGCNRILG